MLEIAVLRPRREARRCSGRAGTSESYEQARGAAVPGLREERQRGRSAGWRSRRAPRRVPRGGGEGGGCGGRPGLLRSPRTTAAAWPRARTVGGEHKRACTRKALLQLNILAFSPICLPLLSKRSMWERSHASIAHSRERPLERPLRSHARTLANANIHTNASRKLSQGR